MAAAAISTPGLHELTSVPAALAWLAQRGARALTADSRQVAARPGTAFLAWPGQACDARQFVASALRNGAVACLLEADGAAAFDLASDARVAVMRDLKAHTGPLASGFFGRPDEQINVIAITGTNGKTSTSGWLAQALTSLGSRCAVVGTLGMGEPPGPLQPTGLTTPDPVTLHAGLRRFVDDGVAACAIEASSIGLQEQRLAGLAIDIAVLTHITQDHLDYHGSMAAYAAAKAQLFTWPGLRAVVLNVDDPYGAALAAQLQLGLVEVWTYSATGQHARLQASGLRYADGGLCFTLHEGAAVVDLRSGLVGDYNAANLLAVVGALRASGFALAEAAAVCAGLVPVLGRLQRIDSAADQPQVVVDYAHTPDALDKALGALRPLAAARGGALWCVFGCGGNRDVTKRPLMGAAAQQGADHAVVTSDNPRHEVPAAILDAIVAGMAAQPRPVVIEDRRAAIAHAVGRAAPQDVVLIAGKGHETQQEIAGVQWPFDDAVEARAALARRAASPAAAAAPAAAVEGAMATLGELQALLPGALLVGAAATPIVRVHSDSRSLRPGDLFIALRGERFDAHDFLPSARAAGAAAALAERDLPQAGLAGLQVSDGGQALAALAGAWRARFTLPLIAVTGSNGKTTVTQMLAAVLRAWHGDAAALATQGNFNNAIGLPLTLLRLRPAHRAAVVELGMNHTGEIAQLAALAAPTVALVNNAQREHQEFMAGVDAVALENGAVIDALPASGTAVLPHSDAFASQWRQRAGRRRVLSFGLSSDAGDSAADVTAAATWAGDHWALELHTPAGRVALHLHVAGEHNVRNAAAAAAGALAAGCPLDAVARGLEAFRPVAGRSQARRLVRDGRDVTLVDDSYNANPDSVRAAIDVLASLPAPRWLVLGDMGEVGSEGVAFHREVGAYARERGIDALWTVGSLSTHAAAAFSGARHFEAAAELLSALHDAPPFATALVKGSRFMRMERVVAALAGEEASHAA